MTERTISAFRVVVGDEVINSLATHPSFRWVAVTSIDYAGDDVIIHTASSRVMKKRMELVVVRSEPRAATPDAVASFSIDAMT